MENIVKKFRNMNYIDFDNHFKEIKSNNDRYNDYLNNKIFKYFNEYQNINDHYIEKEYNNNYFLSGIYENSNTIICNIPKRKTLFDEMICIHELTHLISALKVNMNHYSKYKEIVPYFNEYNYLKIIDINLANEYELFRFNTAIKSAKCKENEDYLSYIIAYLVLQKRKNNYNINKLNKINSRDELEKKLILKGYTI